MAHSGFIIYCNFLLKKTQIEMHGNIITEKWRQHTSLYIRDGTMCRNKKKTKFHKNGDSLVGVLWGFLLGSIARGVRRKGCLFELHVVD